MMTGRIPSMRTRTRLLALAVFLLLAAMGCPKPEPQPPMLPGIFEADNSLDEGRRGKD